MLFSSTFFIFVFLPSVILFYFGRKLIFGNVWRNETLLFFSFLFYLYSGSECFLLLLSGTILDFVLGLLIDRRSNKARLWVAASVIFNIGLLVYFKYANFMVTEFNQTLASFGMTRTGWTSIILPIGISFYTFQRLSYIIDVYRGQAKALNRFSDFALYVSMFPQLVAGPIVRFRDLEDQLRHRRESWEAFYAGAFRFCWGLAKKVLIADACGAVSHAVFGMPPAFLDTASAWLGALAYTLQIYYDFSGYSDMAIGMAAMFGFTLRENFDRPYTAVSITDFWRRWHISLGTWFRDYLYIPLGGSRLGSWRTAVNLTLVFLLCGFWHGANWTFLLWGLYHGFFLAVERAMGMNHPEAGCRSWLGRPRTFLIVLLGWVLFRADNLSAALHFLQTMIIPKAVPMPIELFTALNARNLFFMFLGLLAVLGSSRLPSCEQLIRGHRTRQVVVGSILFLVVLPYCAAFVLQGTGNPFIYFRF